MESPNHYELLCVSPHATDEEIRIAYRRLIRVYHPDVASDAGSAMTQRLNDAQRELLDPALRARYDLSIGHRWADFAVRQPGRARAEAPTSPRDDWRPPASARFTERPSAAWNSGRYAVWMSIMVAAGATIVVATGLVFAYCYVAPFTLLTPRIIPPMVIAMVWLVAGLSRPSLLFSALLVIGAALWPLSVAGVEPFALLSALPASVLPCLTVAAAAAVAFRIAAPRANLLSRLRPRSGRTAPVFGH